MLLSQKCGALHGLLLPCALLVLVLLGLLVLVLLVFVLVVLVLVLLHLLPLLLGGLLPADLDPALLFQLTLLLIPRALPALLPGPCTCCSASARAGWGSPRIPLGPPRVARLSPCVPGRLMQPPHQPELSRAQAVNGQDGAAAVALRDEVGRLGQQGRSLAACVHQAGLHGYGREEAG